MDFSEWLVDNGHISNEDAVEFELSSVELDMLHSEWDAQHG
jgi:hypothetical protein